MPGYYSFELATRGARSGSGVAGSGSVDPVAEPSFVSNIPDITFVQGAADSESLLPYVSGFNSTLHQMTLSAGSLPADVTLDPDGALDYGGTGPTATATGLQITIVDTARADFLARAAACSFATDWSEYADAAAAYNGSACYSANKNPSQGATFTNAFELITTAGHVTGGKALRLWHGKNGQGAGTIDNQFWVMIFNGGKTTGAASASYKTKAYVQLVIWVDAFFDYYWRRAVANGGDGTTPKAFIIDYEGGSATQGEVVVDNQFSRGFVTTYRHTGTFTAALISQSRSTPANSLNFAWQPAVDRGTPATVTTQNQWEQRYGPCYDGMTGGSSQASLLSAQGVPDPDAAMGGIAWNRGGRTVVEIEVDLANDRIRTWAAHYGQSPLLIADTDLDDLGSALVGSRVKTLGTGWNAVHLSNLAFQADWENNPGAPLVYTDYAEVLFSGTPINFPGGFTLPGV